MEAHPQPFLLTASLQLRYQTHARILDNNGKVALTWGFVDGTLWPIVRPLQLQEAAYNGHKHIHALKHQIVSTPNGFLFWLKICSPKAAAEASSKVSPILTKMQLTWEILHDRPN